ncbi:translation initiation factor IF-2 [Clostridium sp. CAG:1193]|nr:translation initiation factor IF-2 [Clostridium sp. CAG:1193]
MMTVKEYALDINKDVKVVLEKCRELGFNAKNEDDMLSEDEVIDLDNQVYNEDEYNLEDKVEEIVSNMKNVKDTSVKVQKLKKKSNIISASDFKKEKKEMYKHKEKLMSNAPDKDENKIVYKEGMTLSMLANLLNDNPVNLIKKFMSLGVMLNMNSPVSFDDAELVVIDYNKELKKEETMDAANFEKLEITDDESLLETRPPVVTIMGHVDHGKTSLLDKIRESSIVSGEAGGITQHIGAYQVEKNGKKITFIDTPGHAAFTEMRARGAAITDIVIIIVAADDGVMPQTKEAIDHAKAAKVPIIVAINKIDKPTANVDKVMTEMTDAGLTPDSWGGDTTFIKISALTGEGIDELLETILLTAEMENLKANPNRYAMGSVIEAKLDKNVGSVVTLLIQNGTLRLGDNVVVGTTFGKVRTLKNDLGIEIASALPSTPVEITGLTELPSAGDKFMAFETEKQAKAIAETRKEKAKQKSNMAKESLSLDDLFSKIEGGKKEINVILKADVKGSEEAVKNSLLKINVEGVKVNVIRSATGAITESDVVLANASEAIIIGFNVRPSSKTKELAKEYNVDIRLHNIIYKVVEELESAMKGMLDPEYEEKVTGEIEVRKLFKFSKVGTIAGSYVTSGIVKSNSKARLIRDGVVIYDGAISSIQREKDTVKEVKQGFECGITLDNYNDIKEGDTIEAYEMVEIKR